MGPAGLTGSVGPPAAPLRPKNPGISSSVSSGLQCGATSYVSTEASSRRSITFAYRGLGARSALLSSRCSPVPRGGLGRVPGPDWAWCREGRVRDAITAVASESGPEHPHEALTLIWALYGGSFGLSSGCRRSRYLGASRSRSGDSWTRTPGSQAPSPPRDAPPSRRERPAQAGLPHGPSFSVRAPSGRAGR
jgi:hypothetical protein